MCLAGIALGDELFLLFIMRFIFRWLSRSKDRLHNVWCGYAFASPTRVTTLHFCYGQPLLSARRMNYQSKCHSSVGQAGNVDKIFFYISFHVLIRSLTPLENTSNLLGYYRYIFGTIKRTILNMIDQPFKKKLIFKDISDLELFKSQLSLKNNLRL